MEKSQIKAVWLMLLAIALFSAMDLAMKLLAESYDPIQVSSLRALSSLPWLLLWCHFVIKVNPAKTKVFKLQLMRGILSVIFLIAGIWTFKLMALASAYLFFFVAPSLVSILSIFFFNEQIGWVRWTAIAGGFVGILVAVLPNQQAFDGFALLVASIAVVGYAISLLMAKQISKTDSDHTTVFYFLLFVSIGATALAMPGWKSIQPQDYLTILLMGIFGILAQYALTAAFRMGEVSLIAPLEYTAFVWAILWDAVFWQVLPNLATYTGAAIIIASGILMMHRERKARRTVISDQSALS